MNVDLTTHAIDHDEVPVSRSFRRLEAIPCRVQHDHQDIEIVAINRHVEVRMLSGLFTDQRVNAPSAVDPQPDTAATAAQYNASTSCDGMQSIGLMAA